MKKLTDEQIKAIAYFDSESLRWARMAKRCKKINCEILASACNSISNIMKNTHEMQSKFLLTDKYILPYNWGSSEKKEILK